MNSTNPLAASKAARARCAAIGLLLMAACVAASAQSSRVYRCGSVMQDRPCDGSLPEPGKPSGTAAGARPAAPSGQGAALPAVAPSAERQCRERGQYAEGVAWKREGGAPLDRQLSEIQGGVNSIEGSAKAAIARRVYATRVPAAEIRASVQADCLQQAARSNANARPYDEQECKMLRDDQQKLAARSGSAANESQRQLYRQVIAEHEEKMLMRGCKAAR